MSDSYLQLTDLTKKFGDETAVDGITLAVERGSVLALLGPSGSGKTTTLRLLAGFERPESGKIVVDDKDVTLQPPVERRFGMVFQHYALFPHLTVAENVAFGLTDRSREAQNGRVAEVLQMVDMDGFGDRQVTELSGGQQQRVAVGLAIVGNPKLILADEPTGNLDTRSGADIMGIFQKLNAEMGITIVFAGAVVTIVADRFVRS